MPEYGCLMTSIDRERDIHAAFVQLADSLQAGHEVVDTMDVLVRSCTAFTSADEAGVMLADSSGALHVVASSSERASDVEEAQLGVAAGPCLESFRTGQPIEIPRIQDISDTWPEFASVARSRGLCAVHAIPISLRGISLGGLNVFSREEGRLTESDAALLEAMAQVSAVSIVYQRRSSEETERSSQLQRALDTRVIIEQAKGVLAHRHNIGMDRAFALIRGQARSTGSRLKDVAEQVVYRRIEI
jgi:GAF domain-containing protein